MKRNLSLLLPLLLFISCRGIIDKEAQAEFFSRSEAFSVTVFPFHVVISDTVIPDYELQVKLADYINEKGWARAVTSEIDLNVPVIWGRNQAKMFKNSGLQFSEHISSMPIATDYALLVESLSIGRERNVGGVHYYLVDNRGRIVACSLSNSHWEVFKSVNPKSRQDALQVAFNLFEEEFK